MVLRAWHISPPTPLGHVTYSKEGLPLDFVRDFIYWDDLPYFIIHDLEKLPHDRV